MVKKGWRTVVYNVVSAVSGMGAFGLLIGFDWTGAGFTQEHALYIVLGWKMVDNAANSYLRKITTTPMGQHR